MPDQDGGKLARVERKEIVLRIPDSRGLQPDELKTVTQFEVVIGKRTVLTTEMEFQAQNLRDDFNEAVSRLLESERKDAVKQERAERAEGRVNLAAWKAKRPKDGEL